jgi:hypothetical protein
MHFFQGKTILCINKLLSVQKKSQRKVGYEKINEKKILDSETTLDSEWRKSWQSSNEEEDAPI